MSQQNLNSNQSSNAQVVYIIQRWSQIVGVYSKFEDAAQVAQASILKGQVCDIITKPIQ